ncbi:MAG: phosphohydrolase [Lachnospiraceae bacterium]
MQFIRTDDLKPGMRLAKPIYNKMGVLLYERETSLTQQGIVSIHNFGLIGIYILEPAEPAPPLSEDELEFERFQTIYLFQLKENIALILASKKPDGLASLAEAIVNKYGTLKHKLNFTQNIRSSADYYYKHSLNVAILSVMMAARMHFNHEQQLAIVYASLLHDIGLLQLAEDLVEKDAKKYTPEELSMLNQMMHKGYQLLQPDLNPYQLPEPALRILSQLTQGYYHPSVAQTETIKWLSGTRVIHVANEYDNLTAMNINKEPVSEVIAIRFLNEYSNIYDVNIVRALTDCISIVPTGCCVELSNGEKAMVVAGNPNSFMKPVVLLFSNNILCDLDSPAYSRSLQIADIMHTMDNRIKIDSETLKQFKTDKYLLKTLERIHEKKIRLGQDLDE